MVSTNFVQVEAEGGLLTEDKWQVSIIMRSHQFLASAPDVVNGSRW